MRFGRHAQWAVPAAVLLCATLVVVLQDTLRREPGGSQFLFGYLNTSTASCNAPACVPAAQCQMNGDVCYQTQCCDMYGTLRTNYGSPCCFGFCGAGDTCVPSSAGTSSANVVVLGGSSAGTNSVPGAASSAGASSAGINSSIGVYAVSSAKPASSKAASSADKYWCCKNPGAGACHGPFTLPKSTADCPSTAVWSTSKQTCDQGCTAPSQCGNGTVNAPEECDDGNTKDGDGCTSACKKESGWQCGSAASVTGASCPTGSTACSAIICQQTTCQDTSIHMGNGCCVCGAACTTCPSASVCK